ncbi:MAG: TIGR02099 family protein, partial [Methylococcaceae bacterium]|nr:TIGR02099 family protein [Methylococcaceae bacterium]
SGDRATDNLVHKLGLFVDSLDLEETSSLLHFFAPLPVEQATLLAQAQLKGSLEQLSLFADLDEKHFAVNGKFTKINVAPSAAMPGIENLTGQLKGSDQLGRVDLATKDARMTTLGFFREALKITKLNGTIEWRQNPDDWIVSSPIIELDSPDLKTKSRLSLSIPKTKGLKPFMDLQTAFTLDDVSKAAHYLPASVMEKSVVDWLDHAFIRGRVPKGNLLFYGNLGDFPFTGGQGVFETLFEVDQLELAYNSEWPNLTDLGGEVLFLQGSLQVDLHKGLSNKVKINQAKVTIPELGKSEHLLIQGKLETTILQGLEFMQKTPLNSPVDKLLDAVEPQGNTQVTLDLKLPLADSATAKVNGSAQLGNAKLRVKALDLGVNQINGALKFNEQGVYSDIIKATALDNPIQINIKSSDLQTAVNVTGRVGVSDLQKQFKIPGWQVAEGATDYQLKLQLPYDDSLPELVVQSKLAGVALDLPGVLAKTREQQRSLSLTFNLADEELLPIYLTYDNQLKAAIKFNIKQQRIESGNILVGTGNVAQSHEAGIKLEINRERLALQDWISLAPSLAQGKDSEAATGAGVSLREINIHSEHGLWKKTDLGLFDLVLKPEGSYWAGDINGSIAKGKLKIPVDLKGADSISLAMDVLDLTVLKQLKSQGEALEPASAPDFMPLLTITSQKTLWQSVDLGKLSLETNRVSNGIVFKRIELDWKISGKTSKTRAQGSLSMPRAGQLLSKLGITKNIMESSAVVDFTGEWNAAPYQFSLMDLQGKIDVDLKSGRILGIEPGFGRVLGMLAMAQWIKRLQLDFSDVYEEGLAINSIHGHFDLLKGKAVTHDLVIDAIPAKITITGETDLINGTLDQVASVVPKSADAVPIAGTIMGRVAALIGRSLTGKDQEGFFFGSQYLVKGMWKDAQIIPLHENDGLLQKTWSGITGFPWLQQPNNQ